MTAGVEDHAIAAPPSSLQLWIDPSFGASGDMMLGALAGYLDAAAGSGRAAQALEPLQRLGLSDVTLRADTVRRGGLASRRVQVHTTITEHHRPWVEIDRLLTDADLPPRAGDGARATFRRLGEVEARQHGVAIDDVEFHEVGAVDAIIDITGAWLLLDAINPEHVSVGPIGLGHGTVAAAHGQLPLPAPATTELLTGAPVRAVDTPAETCTPTGAALLATMADTWGPIPSGTIIASARGAGGRDPDTHPNVITVVGLATTDQTASSEESRLQSGGSLLIECNVDDTTPEILAIAVQHLLDAGADDAWIVPIVMKKGRPAFEVRVLTGPDRHDGLVSLLLAETGSLGCRTIGVTKHVLPREIHQIEVRGQSVRIKVGPHSAKPELDDLVAAAEATGIPVRQLDAEARSSWHQT